MSKILLTTFNLIVFLSGAIAHADEFLLSEQNIYHATKEICHWNTLDVISLLSEQEKLDIIRGQTLVGAEQFEKMLDLIRHDSFEKSFRNFQYTSKSKITQYILNSPAFSKALNDCYGDNKEAHSLIIAKIYSAEYMPKFYSAFLHVALSIGSRKLLTSAFAKNKAAFFAGLSGLLSYYGWTVYDNRKTLGDLINNSNSSDLSDSLKSSELLKVSQPLYKPLIAFEQSKSQTIESEAVSDLNKRYQKLVAFNQSQIKILEIQANLFHDPRSQTKINLLKKITALQNINRNILTKSTEKIISLKTKDGPNENFQ